MLDFGIDDISSLYMIITSLKRYAMTQFNSYVTVQVLTLQLLYGVNQCRDMYQPPKNGQIRFEQMFFFCVCVKTVDLKLPILTMKH